MTPAATLTEAMPTWEKFIEAYKPDIGRKPKVSNIYIGQDEYNAIRNAVIAITTHTEDER